MADPTKCEKELAKAEALIAAVTAAGARPTKQQAIDLLRATYCLDIVWRGQNNVVVDASDEEPCSVEKKYRSWPFGTTHEETLNALDMVGATKVTRRYRNSHSPKKRFTMPCPACFGVGKGPEWDDLAVNNWKGGRPRNDSNPNYPDCAVPNKADVRYYDICCVQNEIFINGSGRKGAICDTVAHTYGDVRAIYNKVYGKGAIGPTPCPGAGGLVFNAKARVGIKIIITYEAYAYYKDGLKRVPKQAFDTIYFGGDIESISPLKAIVELEETNRPAKNKDGSWRGVNPEEAKAYKNYDGYVKGCVELRKQAQREGRPCGEFGCSPCPWYSVSIACGLKFWECRATGKDKKDIRCTESGFSVSDNTSPVSDIGGVAQLETLGQVINKSISGADEGACEDNQVQRRGALPCKPPEAIASLASKALTVADEIKRYNWSSAIEAVAAKAIENAKNALPPDPCSPIGYNFEDIKFVPVYT